MIVHPHPDLVNAYDPQYGIARLSDRREQITTVAIRLWATGEWPNAKFQPTHWMPLPDPPGSTSTQGDR